MVLMWWQGQDQCQYVQQVTAQYTTCNMTTCSLQVQNAQQIFPVTGSFKFGVSCSSVHIILPCHYRMYKWCGNIPTTFVDDTKVLSKHSKVRGRYHLQFIVQNISFLLHNVQMLQKHAHYKYYSSDNCSFGLWKQSFVSALVHITTYQKTFLLVIHECPPNCILRIAFAWADFSFLLRVSPIYLPLKPPYCITVIYPHTWSDQNWEFLKCYSVLVH